jgi:predicted nucleic acid-binding protein
MPLDSAYFGACAMPRQVKRSWPLFEADLANGHFDLPTCNLASVLIEAKRLSASHTLTGGHRAFDILHVAAALHLGAQEFLTFDSNQRQLAQAAGLRAGP